MSGILNEILKNAKNKTEISLVRSFFKNNKINKNISEKTFLNKIKGYDRSDETKKKLLGVIGRTFSYKSFQQEYAEIIRKLNIKYKQNKPNSEKERRALEITYEMLLEKLPCILSSNTSKKGLLYSLLIGIKNTPRLDYRSMKYLPKKKFDNKKRTDLNFICKKNNKFIIILNRYKNSKYHKQWVIKVDSDELNDYITRYVKDFNIKNGDLLFPTERGLEFSSSSFSSFVSNTFKKIIGVPIDISTLRKIKAMSLIHNNPEILKLSLEEKDKLAIELLRHNYENSALYYNKPDNSKSK